MDDMYLGLNFRVISRDQIPFADQTLRDRERIVNTEGDELIWIEKYKGYLLLTDDPTHYLPINHVYSKWKKVNI